MTGLQIQRGVGTSTNGPGAFGATVSVNTLGTLAKPGIRAVLGGGSFGTQRRTLAWNTGMLQDGWSFEGRASRITSDGWLDRATSDLSSLVRPCGQALGDRVDLSLTTTLGHERTYQAWAWRPPLIVADPESTEEDILNWVQGSGEYDYGADTVRVEDLLENRAQHNYYRYENEVDDYRQDHYQLHLDQTMGDWNFGGVVFTTLGAGYYEQFRQGDDLSDYGFNPIVTNVLDTTGSCWGQTRFPTDLVRRRWLDNTLVGIVLDGEHVHRSCGSKCMDFGARSTKGTTSESSFGWMWRRCRAWRRVLQLPGREDDLSRLASGLAM